MRGCDTAQRCEGKSTHVQSINQRRQGPALRWPTSTCRACPHLRVGGLPGGMVGRRGRRRSALLGDHDVLGEL